MSQTVSGDIMWHLWYLMGLGGGLALSAIIIFWSARQFAQTKSQEVRSEMVWNMVGSIAIMPIAGIFFAAAVYMLVLP
jgi:hypothetical protein